MSHIDGVAVLFFTAFIFTKLCCASPNNLALEAYHSLTTHSINTTNQGSNQSAARFERRGLTSRGFLHEETAKHESFR